MEFFKKAKWTYILQSIIMVALGLAIIIKPELSLRVLCYITGISALIIGLVKLIGYFADKTNMKMDFAIGLIAIIIGILLVVRPDSVMMILPTLFGIYIIMDSIFKLQTSIDAGRAKVSRWWIMLIVALVCAAFGVLIVVNPFTTQVILMIFLGICMLFDGIENIFALFYVAHIAKKAKEKETLSVESEKKDDK